MTSYLCSVAGKRFFFRTNWPTASIQSAIYTEPWPRCVDFHLFSSLVSSYRRVCISFSASFPPVRFLFPSVHVQLSCSLFPPLFPRLSAEPPSVIVVPSFLSDYALPFLLSLSLSLVNQQLRNFQRQKSGRTRKMNDRPRCWTTPSLKQRADDFLFWPERARVRSVVRSHVPFFLLVGPFGNWNDVSSLQANCPVPGIVPATLKRLARYALTSSTFPPFFPPLPHVSFLFHHVRFLSLPATISLVD